MKTNTEIVFLWKYNSFLSVEGRISLFYFGVQYILSVLLLNQQHYFDCWVKRNFTLSLDLSAKYLYTYILINLFYNKLSYKVIESKMDISYKYAWYIKFL